MPAKRQFKMQLEDDMIDRLKSASKRFGRDTAQEVAEEILVLYYPVWLAVSESARRAVEYQTRKMNELNERQANAISQGVRVAPNSKHRIPLIKSPTQEKTRKMGGVKARK